MATIKRLDRLDVITADVNDAIATYQRNFNLAVKSAADGKSAEVIIGDALISLIPSPQADAEGMSGVWLEAENVDAVSVALGKAGYSFKPIRVDGSRRVLEVEPESANQVALFIFDRKV
ncbi:MAG: VOC family protein [Candidatus Binataceae bacterium]